MISKIISLPILPDQEYFGRLQLIKYNDGCIVVTIIRDKEVPSLLVKGAKDIEGISLQAGLDKINSKKLKDFLV